MAEGKRSAALAALVALTLALAGCEPSSPPRSAKAPRCPPPPEPARQSVVVGTVGKMHMVESRYPLSRLGDVMAAFKPDLVLVAVRVEAYRDGRLEEASFEHTYVAEIAKRLGVPVEPVDWFRVEDVLAAPAPVEPFDAVEIEKREARLLAEPRSYTFEQANDADLAERVLLATTAAARYRTGDPLASRRRAWVQHLTADAAARHGKPKRILAYVDVLDRPLVDMTLHELGYASRSPVDVVEKSKEVIAFDLPAEVLASYEKQLASARARASSAEDKERAFWSTRARELEVVVERKAACCVTESAFRP